MLLTNNYKLSLLMIYTLLPALLLLTSFRSEPINPIPKVMERIVANIYSKGEVDRFKEISQQDIVSYLDASSLDILAKEYWTFQVNTDVEVFVCRDLNQKQAPFWLLQQSFVKTNETITNENVVYEVWRKVFKKGKVNLGINGFDRHRYVYFVAIKPLDKNVNIHIKPIWPLDQHIEPLQIGSVIYKDWDELTVNQFTAVFKDSYILSTYRGRSREAHLINAFRETRYPSTKVPDQLLLSFKEDPKTTQHISWRNNNTIISSSLIYWQKGTKDTLRKKADFEVIKDVLLVNDPVVNRFNVNLEGLQPNTEYEFQILSNTNRSKVYSFATAPASNAFEFGWFGDMHNDSKLASFIPYWKSTFPKANFYLQAGDLVNTGLYRDHWDELWNATKSITDEKPFMTVPGNHDSQELLFPWMYLSYLKFPQNGPKDLSKGLSYSFNYGNATFLMLDAVTFSAKQQQKWIEQVLAASKQKFKIVVFHFSPHTFESTYEDMIQLWEPLFVKYRVDLIFNGHFHYYHRTKDKNIPTYIMSVATRQKGENITENKDAYFLQKGYLYQHVKINDGELELISVDSVGTIIDQFKIIKN